MTNKNNIPRLRFPEFTVEWEEKILSEMIDDISSGKTHKLDYGKFPIYGSVGEIGRTDEADYEGEYLLIARVGANAGLIKYVDTKFGATDNTLVLTAKMTNLIFLKILLNKIDLNRLCFGSGQPLITGTLIKNLRLYTPNISEQQKIAAFFTTIDKKIEKLQELHRLNVLYKKAVMQKIFNQEIRFKDNNGNDYPDWEEKTLGEVVVVKKGEQLNKEILTKDSKYPVINGGITPSGYYNSYNVLAETITISEGGNSCGFVNYMKTNFWAGGHCYYLSEYSVDKNYIFQYLKFKENNLMELRVGSGLPNIQKNSLVQFNVVIPILFEQQKIADFLSLIDTKIEDINRTIEKTKEWKNGLLQQMLV